MASKGKQTKKENAVVRYFRETKEELQKVRWPSLEQGWVMTKVVITVTVVAAVFLGVLDFFFGWMISFIVARNPIFYVVGLVVMLGLLGAAYWIGQGEEV